MKLLITGHHFQFISVPKGYDMPKELRADTTVWAFALLDLMFSKVHMTREG